MKDLHPTAAEGFGKDSATYSRGRPGFPPGALQWLREDLQLASGKTVLELGAGTGKFTALLTKTGAEVIAVEPVMAMLERLAEDLPGVHALPATAQMLPLAAASVDVVICAQSFHWFASPKTLLEIRRVLKPGGELGLIWNVRDASVPWVSALEELIARHEGDAPRYYNGEWREVFPAPGFGPFREKSLAHVHTGSAENVIVDRVASVSFIAALPEAERQTLLAQVRALIARTPALAHSSLVNMPYVTRMYWCRTAEAR